MMYTCTISMMYIANEISHSDWLLETSPLVHNITHGISKYGAVIALKVRRRSGNTTQNFLFTAKYYDKQLETAKQNPDACDCVWIDG